MTSSPAWRNRILVPGGVLLLLLLVSCCHWSFQDDTGTSDTADGAGVTGLPDGATDIRWHLPGAFQSHTYYEFTVDQAGYEQWVQNHRGPELEGPKRGPILVFRYDHAAEASKQLELVNTIAYTWNDEDRGIYLVFDLDSERAYYWTHSR